MSAPPVSAVIIAANAADVIQPCLQSLAFLPDIVVYLNNSNDATRELCARYPNVRVIDGEFTGFGPTRNSAAAHAHNDWILSIDTDEWLDQTLASSVQRADFSDPARAFVMLRRNRFHGRHVAVGGWGNDRLTRIYHRTTARFNDKAVHERIVLDNAVQSSELHGTLWHEAVVDIDQFLKKISRYSELAADSRPGGPGTHPFFALLRGQFAFFRSYVLQLGFTAGWRGLIIAYARSVGTFFKYAKRYERRIRTKQQAP
ncbi:MAG: glycosyltransferase family 2 protein [Pseudomonadota bacterium]